MQRIELIRARHVGQNRVLQPVPLRHTRLDQRGRRIGVVFEHFWRARISLVSVPGKIEAAKQCRFVVVPGALDHRNELGGNREVFISALVDHMACRTDTHLMQLGGGILQRIDFCGSKAIAGALIPVDAIDRMKAEAQVLHFFRPIGTRHHLESLHDCVIFTINPKPNDHSSQIRRATLLLSRWSCRCGMEKMMTRQRNTSDRSSASPRHCR